MKLLRDFLTIIAVQSVYGSLQQESSEVVPAQIGVASQVQSPSERGSQGFEISDAYNISSLGILLLYQFFPAKTTDIFPTIPLISLLPNSTLYKMKICDRADVKLCLLTGEST
jgi:hypothetical protein